MELLVCWAGVRLGKRGGVCVSLLGERKTQLYLAVLTANAEQQADHVWLNNSQDFEVFLDHVFALDIGSNLTKQ